MMARPANGVLERKIKLRLGSYGHRCVFYGFINARNNTIRYATVSFPISNVPHLVRKDTFFLYRASASAVHWKTMQVVRRLAPQETATNFQPNSFLVIYIPLFQVVHLQDGHQWNI
jgi:hypothetical protein